MHIYYNYRAICVYIYFTILFNFFIQAAEPKDYLEHKIPPIISKKIEDGIYILERFYAATPNAKKLPLLSGPACPCIIIFAAKPGCIDVFGVHLYHLSSIAHTIESINNFYQLPSYGKKAELVFSLFTRTYAIVNTDFSFKEGSHLKRFQSLMYALDSAYTILNCSYYFNDSPIVASSADRWVVCTGLDEKNKLQVYRFDPIGSGTFKSKEHIDNYTFLEYQKTFGLHQLMNILPDNIWETYDQNLIKMESKSNIAIINNMEISPENSMNKLLAYRRKAQEDVFYGKNTKIRALAEQKLINVDY